MYEVMCEGGKRDFIIVKKKIVTQLMVLNISLILLTKYSFKHIFFSVLVKIY